MATAPQPAGSPAPLATLAFSAGPNYGRELPVPNPVVTLGRGPESDVQIEDDSVSVRHARLEFDMGAWRITDLDSTNGTAVEGVRLAPGVPTPIPYGATVRLGGVRLHFREVEGASPEAAAAAYVEPAPAPTLREERRGLRIPVWLAFVLLVIAVAIAILVYSLVSPPTQPGTPLPAETPPTATGAEPVPAPVAPAPEPGPAPSTDAPGAEEAGPAAESPDVAEDPPAAEPGDTAS